MKFIKIVIPASFTVILISVIFLVLFKPRNYILPTEEFGVKKEEILIGSSLAKTGLVGYLGNEYEKGAKVYFDKINDAGGVFGRKIRLITYDDGYIPSKTIQNIQKLLVDDQVFALFNFVGSSNGAKALPMVQDAKVPLVGIFSGAAILRDPVNKYVFNIRPSYYEETEYFIKGAVDQLGMSKIAVFYQNDDFGLDGLQGVREALKRRGLVPVAEASYNRGSLEVDSAVQVIVESKAEAVAMIATYSQAAKFIELARQSKFEPLFLSLSVVGSEELIKTLGGNTKGLFITQILPPPYVINDVQFEPNTKDILNEYAADLAKYSGAELPSFGSLEGYLNAKILVEGMKIAGPELTREKLILALESIKDLELGSGQSVSFSKNKHQGMSKLYFTYWSGSKFVEVSDLIDVYLR